MRTGGEWLIAEVERLRIAADILAKLAAAVNADSDRWVDSTVFERFVKGVVELNEAESAYLAAALSSEPPQ
jgi:hypothetical protein